MPPLVRSDVNIAYKLILKDGRVVDVGGYARDEERIRDFAERIKAHEIPHLQRLSPDKAWLASLDAERKMLWLHDPEQPNDFRVLRVRLSGLSGSVKTFRWLKDGSGIIVHTRMNLWHVPLNDRDQLEDMTSVLAQPLIKGPVALQVQDFRMMRKGFIVRANSRLYRAKLQPEFEMRNITPHKKYVYSAFVGQKDRIYMTVGKNPWIHTTQLWVLESDGRDLPSLRGIASEWQDGATLNWAAHNGWLAMARSWHHLTLFRGDAEGKMEELKLEMDPALPFDNVHTLWSDEKGERLLSSTSSTLRMWSPEGKLLWSWSETKEAEDKIYSAQFGPDGASVVASLKDRVVLIRDGEIVETLVSKEQAEELGIKDKHTFFESAQLLSDGSLAVAVVRAKETVTWQNVRPRRHLRPRPGPRPLIPSS